MTRPAATGNRTKRLAMVHMAKKSLGLDDATYRAMLHNVTGHRSAARCTDVELSAVLRALRAAGWRPRKRLPVTAEQRGYHATEAQRDYLKGLWELASREKSERSLRAMLRRIAGVDHIRFLDKSGATKVILALRAIAEAAGFDPDGPGDA